MVTRSGELIIKMLKRNAALNETDFVAGPPIEQFAKLKVPPKTQLYMEQVRRETRVPVVRFDITH